MISKAPQESHNCKLISTTPHHPQTNGLVESSHEALKRSLIKSIGKKSGNWSHYLEQVIYSLNIRPRKKTTIDSAFELMNGSRRPRLPSKIENLQFLYPDIVDTDTEVETYAEADSNGSQVTDLVKFTKTKQEHIFEVAGKI